MNTDFKRMNTPGLIWSLCSLCYELGIHEAQGHDIADLKAEAEACKKELEERVLSVIE